MALLDDKEIAKDIIVKMIEGGLIQKVNYPEAQNITDAVCEAYKKVLKTVKED